jgi:hypothetical protein
VTLARASSALVWAIWLLILLLELATPPAVVLGILYVVPLLLGAAGARGYLHKERALAQVELALASLMVGARRPHPARTGGAGLPGGGR